MAEIPPPEAEVPSGSPSALASRPEGHHAQAGDPLREPCAPPSPASGLLGDLQDPRLMYLKAALFLVAGTVSALALFLERPTLQTAFLLVVAIWSFCRLYYFMFYVIEKYVDGRFRFAGVGSFLAYLLEKRGRRRPR